LGVRDRERGGKVLPVKPRVLKNRGGKTPRPPDEKVNFNPFGSPLPKRGPGGKGGGGFPGGGPPGGGYPL